MILVPKERWPPWLQAEKNLKSEASCHGACTHRHRAGLPYLCHQKAGFLSECLPTPTVNPWPWAVTRSVAALVLCIPLRPHLPDSRSLTSVLTPSSNLLTSNPWTCTFSLLVTPHASHLSLPSLDSTGHTSDTPTQMPSIPPQAHLAKPQTNSHLLTACSQMAECSWREAHRLLTSFTATNIHKY